MRARRILFLATAGAIATLPSAAAAFPGKLEPGSRLEAAREEAGEGARPQSRYDLPAGELRVTPAEALAGVAGQRLRFAVTLDRRVPGATLHVTLPARWLTVPASRLPAVRGPEQTGHARGRARMRRSARDVALAFDDAAAGATASFEVVDNGIPAGTYRLPFRWVDDATGHTTRAGTASIVLYAPTREPGPRALASPGLAFNVTNDTLEESETFIATTQGNSSRILVGVNWPSASMAAWISTDTGQTWTRRTLPETLDAPGKATNESGDICCDPMAAADGLGNLWFGGLSFRRNASNPSRIVVNRVAAGGNTMQAISTGLPVRTTGTQDKPMMTIDNSASSPTFGRLYVVWDEPAAGGINLVISKCDTRPGGVSNPANCDNADNWSTPVSVTPSTGSYIYGDVAVGPDGRVYVTWWDYSNVNAIRGDVCDPSTQTCTAASGWGTPQTIAVLDSTGGTPLPFACPILAQPGGRASTAPNVDVDHSGGAQNGRVWVTWSDLRPGSGSTRCAEDPSTGDGTPPLATHQTFDSFVATAAGGALPGGNSPSASVATRLLTDGEGGGQSNSDDWFPWLAVDQTTGEAWANFYSTREDSTRQTTNFYARSVTPGSGGALPTVGPLTKVSNGVSDHSGNPCCTFGNDYGDYTGIDATSGLAFPVWSDNSSGSGDSEAFAFVPAGAPPQAPSVTTGAATSVTPTTASLTGTVNPNGQSTTYHFEYGTDTNYGTSTSSTSAGSGSTGQAATASLSGLQASTTYHYRLVATNNTGTTAGNDAQFTTPAAPVAPEVTTGSATGPTTSGATLNGTVNPKGQATNWRFRYGKTTSYELGTTGDQGAGSGTADVPVSAALSGLDPGTTYHFKLSATNATGTTEGNDAQFTTAATPPPLQPPVVTTGSATGVDETTATVGGTVNPNGQSTTFRFEYGIDTNYGQSAPSPDGTAGNGSSAVPVSQPLSGLSPNTTYHYRLVATNGTGTTDGDDASFQTSGPAPPPSQVPSAITGQPTAVSQSAATLTATVNPNGQATTYRFDYGPTSQYGAQTQDVSAGSGTQDVAGSVPLGGLAAGTTYHYRVTATNPTGTTNGGDVAFTTASPTTSGGGGSPTGGSPGSSQTPGTPTPTPTTPTPTLTYSVRVPATQRPAGVARRGLTLTARCGVACRLSLRLYVTGTAIRQLGLARNSRIVTLSTATARRATAGTLRVTLPVSQRIRTSLGRASTIALRLRISALALSGARAPLRVWRVTLRRSGRSPLVTALGLSRATAASWTAWAPAAALQQPGRAG